MFEHLIGDPGAISVQRALGDWRAGLPILLASDGQQSLVLPVDALDEPRLALLRQATGGRLRLAVTGHRAAALGVDGLRAAVVDLEPNIDTARILHLAKGAQAQFTTSARAGGDVATAAIELAKLALLLPAAVLAPLSDEMVAELCPQAVRVAPQDVLRFPAACVRSIRLISRARVPLRPDIDTEFVIFRNVLGRTMTAVIVGMPDLAKPVPTRLHSACLTGDSFGSMRCDCGDQLRMSLEILSECGGGVLLYLDQEGCGIGLANKMRAYSLQDGGLDTIDANTTLGFASDERRYDSAARMLALLGIGRVSLLTNNPAKLKGLADAGIEIADRIPLIAPVHSANRRYLHAKASRAGHLLDGLSDQPTPVHPDA